VIVSALHSGVNKLVIALTANCDVDHGMTLGRGFKLMIRMSLMPKDDRNLLDVLKFELELLEQGG